ncbi:MAG: dephospho-CoA kinase [Thermodesulfobacteriota bacterium]
MIIAGLTGGIATGKSIVASCLAEHGALIIDADQIAHEVVARGKPAWEEIVKTFGETYLLPDGEIDRKALGKTVFDDTAKRNLLNHIVHPRVFEEISRAITATIEAHEAHDPVIILDVPLLFETKMDVELPEVIVVFAPAETQLDRLMARDNLSREDALARINSQIPITEKKDKADYVIDNSGSIDVTREQTTALFTVLKAKAETKAEE